MGISQSTPFEQGIKAALHHEEDSYAFPDKPFFESRNVRLYNLSYPVKPAVVTYPKTAAQVAAIVKCARDNGLKVQARSGGHSYANYCLGGVDGAVVIDLQHFQHFSMDHRTWRATAGPGTLLGDLTKRMHDAGKRAMAHGTCPQVGLGGHATIGGLGPSSRMWGAALDHVEEVEVVLADSSIVRANKSKNPDVFWAIKGAGASFGIVTSFTLRTEPAPGHAIHFTYSFTSGRFTAMAQIFKNWQNFISNPDLTRRFASEFVIASVGVIVSGTFFGNQDEFDAFRLDDHFPGHDDKKTLLFNNWLGLLAHWGETEALRLGGGIPSPSYTKTLTFNGCNLIPEPVVDRLFHYLETAAKGTKIWFCIFDLQGGAVNDVAETATSYAHRDALFYLQSYAIGYPHVRDETRAFLKGMNEVVVQGMREEGEKTDFGAYAGYVDPELLGAQREYWRGNLPRLEVIKANVDPNEVFWNPQSVRPAGWRKGSVEKGEVTIVKKEEGGWFSCF